MPGQTRPRSPRALRHEPILYGAFYGGGIIATLCVYGLLQERIMTLPYGSPPMYFKDSVFLVFLNRMAALLFAIVMAWRANEPLVNKAPLWKYLAISFSNVGASTCQYEALKYVSFPVQMLGKSFKMMPVMMWGILVGGKSYGRQDWTIAALVTGGVTEFLMTGPISGSDEANSSMRGLCLLICFLFLDGFTSTFQERLFKEHATSKYNQMLYVNLFSCIVSSATLIASGGVVRSIAFIMENPRFGLDAMVLSTSAVASQWCIYSMVKEFGALAFAATMNVRQVVSILLSYIRYGHYITVAQVLGLLIVFSALFYKTYAAMPVYQTSENAPLLNKPVEEAIEDSPVDPIKKWCGGLPGSPTLDN